MSNKHLDDANDLLEGVVPEVTLGPETERRVLVMPSNVTAAAGGRLARARPMRPGRASQDDLEFVAQCEEERLAYMANDLVTRTVKQQDSQGLLQAVKQGLAEECAALGYQRMIAERMGREVSAISSRRIEALRKMADIELEMRKIGVDHIDVRGEKFQRIISLWVDTIRRVAEATLNAEMSDVFFNRLTSEMEGWEERAEEVIR